MRVLVVAGGTGSTNLQIGLHKAGIGYELLLNAYDDGKSTGFVRRVANCLGPSDIRKNLHTMLGIRDSQSPYLSTLGCRFDAPTSVAAKEFCTARCALTDCMIEGLAGWFTFAGLQEYRDVSVVNLALGGLARSIGSMQEAADWMAIGLGLPPVIHLNSDLNHELFALSRSGALASEGEIVTWNRPEDPLERLEFRLHGVSSIPALCDRAVDAIGRADAVVISAGTLFSSILPTLQSQGFRQALGGRPAVVIENLTMDADVAGYEPEQALGMVLDALEGSYLHVVPRGRADLPDGLNHDPDRLVQAILECVS